MFKKDAEHLISRIHGLKAKEFSVWKHNNQTRTSMKLEVFKKPAPLDIATHKIRKLDNHLTFLRYTLLTQSTPLLYCK